MSRSIRVFLAAIVVIAAAAPAFAEFTGASEVPFEAVFYCDCSREDVILEGTVLSEWDWANDGATWWRVSFAGVRGIGALSGRRYEVVGEVLERFAPALGGANAVAQASPELLVCNAGSGGVVSCLRWNVTIRLGGEGNPTAAVRISGYCRKV